MFASWGPERLRHLPNVYHLVGRFFPCRQRNSTLIELGFFSYDAQVKAILTLLQILRWAGGRINWRKPFRSRKEARQLRKAPFICIVDIALVTIGREIGAFRRLSAMRRHRICEHWGTPLQVHIWLAGGSLSQSENFIINFRFKWIPAHESGQRYSWRVL